MLNWAEEVELDSGTDSEDLPPSSESRDADGNKVITEYKINKDGKRVKHVRTYKTIKKAVSEHVARRKQLPKFGDSAGDADGPNSYTTFVSEEVELELLANKKEDDLDSNGKIMITTSLWRSHILTFFLLLVPKCRLCSKAHSASSDCPFKKCRFCAKGHLTTDCPSKDTQDYYDKILKQKAPKYVPGYGQEETFVVRISNLPDTTNEEDLIELTRPFGKVVKKYLAMDKKNLCKGFAYIHYLEMEDAMAAINTLNGYKYDHLILKAELSLPKLES